MTEFETKTVSCGFGGLFPMMTVLVCKTCGAMVFDRELHEISHAWPGMTLHQKLAYARRKRAAGETNVYTESIKREV